MSDTALVFLSRHTVLSDGGGEDHLAKGTDGTASHSIPYHAGQLVATRNVTTSSGRLVIVLSAAGVGLLGSSWLQIKLNGVELVKKTGSECFVDAGSNVMFGTVSVESNIEAATHEVIGTITASQASWIHLSTHCVKSE